ncbi:MAG: L,D-transpeptidase [Candidatus Daviesbacteria bacterium]
MHKFLPFLIITVLLVTVYFYLPLKRELAYKLNLANDPTTSCCDVADITKTSGTFDEAASIAIFNNQIVDYPKTSLAQMNLPSPSEPQVLGTTNASGEEKWIEISLADQKLRAWEGNRTVMEFPISSGLWYPTPKGDFSIWYKTRAQRMKGGSRELGTFYNLPNVPHNMFFYQGFAIHGAYWHNNFGHPMSHGCVNSPLASAAQLFEWSGPIVPQGQGVVRATPENPGTRVFVH